MKVILLEHPGRFTQIDMARPAAPGPGEALVRVHRVGICGTDISGYLGKMPVYTYPRIPGHELGVEVISVGPGVTNVAPSDRCSVEPYLNCGHCTACGRGRSNCCETLQVLGVHTDGGLRGQIVVPAHKLHKSARLTLDQLALVETLVIGCHAVNRAAPQANEHVLVIGAGPIGLAAMEFVKLTGAKLTVLDLNPRRLEFCRQLGVEQTIQASSGEAMLDQLRRFTGGMLPTVVFDATGSAQSMSRAFELVEHTGTLVLVGITAGDVSFHDPLLHRRELTLCASRNGLPADFRRVIQLIEEGRIDTRPWITHRTTLDDLIDDFPAYTRPETGVVKAMVDIGE